MSEILVKNASFNDVRSAVNGMLAELLEAGRNNKSVEQGSWTPAVDVTETADALIITAELAGVKKEDIRLETKENMLILAGRRVLAEHKDSAFSLQEINAGEFYRAFKVGIKVEINNAKATFDNGLLTVVLPKAADIKPGRIEIQ